jgi:hypothetical protein
MPARSAASAPSLVVDLDEIVAKPVGFRLGGKLYRLDVVSTKNWLKLIDAEQKIKDLQKSAVESGDVKNAEVVQSYYDYLSILAPEMTYEMVESLTLSQVLAVIKLVSKQIVDSSEPIDVSGEKKKT